MSTMTPMTQKAQGIVAIQDGCSSINLQGPGFPLMVIPGGYLDCPTSCITWPMFARPCPFRPRHGFVESICVHSWEEVITLLQKAKSAGGPFPVELVLAPLLTGKVSAVATNAGVTWGHGNDGVTSGKDPRALLIPVKTSKVSWRVSVMDMIARSPSFEIPEFPYLEIVEDKGDMRLVQVRDGPEQPEGANHVVRKMKVKHVLKATSDLDLLAWESLVIMATREKGTVIWAPDMSLASHFCVHGIESGIPVITDREVKVGDVIQPTKNKTSTLGKRDYVKVAAMITKTLGQSLRLPFIDIQRSAVLTAIATTQAQFYWGKTAHLLRLRSLSVTILLKAVLASCAGELRHWETSDGPRYGAPSLYNVLGGVNNLSTNRHKIYKNVFNRPLTLSDIKYALDAAETDFGHRNWGRSFGGPRWAEVAAIGAELAKATKYFCAQPSAAEWSKVVKKANRLINTSHNNGKCLTKWVNEHAMKMISLSPTVGFLNPYVPLVALKKPDAEEKS